jgi:hypothetical protein
MSDLKSALNDIQKAFDSWSHEGRAAGEGSRGGKVVGHSPSGKPIYGGGSAYARHDRMEKERAKTKAARKEFQNSGLDLANMKTKSVDNALYDLIKAGGEGSRGGRVIGHTRSGKPIYDTDKMKAKRDRLSEDISKWLGSPTKVSYWEHVADGIVLTTNRGKYRTRWTYAGNLDSVMKQSGRNDNRGQSVPRTTPSRGSKMNKSGFIAKSGPGGLLFDFGNTTGNPVADNMTRHLNHFADPTQEAIVTDQRALFSKAINEYVDQGEHVYHANQQKTGFKDEGLSKSTDERVVEMLKSGELDCESTSLNGPGQNIKGDFNKSAITVGGEKAVAQSPTDAAVVEMMKNIGDEGMNGSDT